MNEIEVDLLNCPDKLCSMNNLMLEYQFSENFLIKTRIYYDSYKCLRRQNNLSPYFCFRYLYDTPEYDAADDWTDYSQVYDYLKKRKYSDEEIKKAYEQAMKDRKNINL